MTNFTSLLRKTPPIKLKEDTFIQRIGLISIGVSLIIILSIMSLFVLYTKQKNQQEITTYGYALTDMVSNYFVNGPDGADAKNIIDIVEMLGRKSGLVYAMVMDRDRKITAHTNSNDAGRILNDALSVQIASSTNPLKQTYRDPDTQLEILEFSRPLYSGAEKIGAVRLGFSQDAFPLFSDNEIRGLLLIATLIFSLVPVFYYLVRRSPKLLTSFDEELNQLLSRNHMETVTDVAGKSSGSVSDRFNHIMSRYKNQYHNLKTSCEDMEVANGILSYEKERIESVIENIEDGVLVRDLVGNIIFINRAMTNLLKLSREQVIGKTIRDCIDNEDIISFIERNQLNKNSFTQKNQEIVLKQAGEDKIVLISYLPLYSADENALGNIIIGRDITESKIMQKNQSDFIVHVSHELRTPLTTIKSYIEMLMDDEVSDRDTTIDFYNTINDEVNRLSRLINNLLNISQIETGNLIMGKSMIKTHEFFKDIIRSIESQANSRNIHFKTVLPDKLSAMMGEKDMLSVSILNILNNALKYTPSGGSVKFSAEESDSEIKVHISDSGFGISEDELPHIFDKFFRSSDENIKKHTGNGLGLALSREIIKLHNGKIELDSELGKGTHFTLIFSKEESPRIGNYNGSMSSLMDNK
jgi:PAS domain S-box-containing protein